MKILVNTSNLYVGGGVQVALSFIHELNALKFKHEYYILTSKAINKQINQDAFANNFKFYCINKSPSSLKTRNKVVSQLDLLEEQISPDIVFSVFGPSYWRPKAKHLIGFADGWVYNPDSVAYNKLSFFKRIKIRLYSAYKSYYLKKDADYYVLETDDAKIKFVKTIGVDSDKVYVVGNTYSSIFDDSRYMDKDNKSYITLPKKVDNEFRFMYIAHNHANKNLKIINEIVPYLKDKNIKFVLTIDNNSYNKLFYNSTNIINLGPISQKSCPSIYKQCDALFAPTLLETFSAAYPEAMKMNVPILTSKYSFATDICGDAALYFDPLDPKNIVETIISLVENKTLQLDLIKKGKKQVKTFETAQSRAKKYITLCENIVGF